ncbi:unnamed protein product, partial [Polarella glacialis]
MAFDGEPSAAEHCAKGLHAKLLKRLAKGCKSDAELSRALGGSLLDLDVELRESRPGMKGCGGVAALVCGRRLCLAMAGDCGGTLWGPSSAAIGSSASAESAGSIVGQDGVLRRVGATKNDAQKRAKGLLRLRAKNPSQQL